MAPKRNRRKKSKAAAAAGADKDAAKADAEPVAADAATTTADDDGNAAVDAPASNTPCAADTTPVTTEAVAVEAVPEAAPESPSEPSVAVVSAPTPTAAAAAAVPAAVAPSTPAPAPAATTVVSSPAGGPSVVASTIGQPEALTEAAAVEVDGAADGWSDTGEAGHAPPPTAWPVKQASAVSAPALVVDAADSTPPKAADDAAPTTTTSAPTPAPASSASSSESSVDAAHLRPEFPASVSSIVRDVYAANDVVSAKRVAAQSAAHSDMESRITKRRASQVALGSVPSTPTAAATITGFAAVTPAAAIASTAATPATFHTPSAAVVSTPAVSAAPAASVKSVSTAARAALFVRHLQSRVALTRDEHAVLSGALNDVERVDAADDDWGDDAPAPAAAASADVKAAAAPSAAPSSSDATMSVIFRNRLITFHRHNPLLAVTAAKMNAMQLVALVRAHLRDKQDKARLLNAAAAGAVPRAKPTAAASDAKRPSIVLTPAGTNATVAVTGAKAPSAVTASAFSRPLSDALRVFDFNDPYRSGFLEPQRFVNVTRELALPDDVLRDELGAGGKHHNPVSRVAFAEWWKARQSAVGYRPKAAPPAVAVAAAAPTASATAAAAAAKRDSLSAPTVAAATLGAGVLPAARPTGAFDASDAAQRARVLSEVSDRFASIRMNLRELEVLLHQHAGATTFVGGVH